MWKDFLSLKYYRCLEGQQIVFYAKRKGMIGLIPFLILGEIKKYKRTRFTSPQLQFRPFHLLYIKG